jgi:filamentous hemagglutinin
LVSHAILGATLACINGGDPTAGGSAAFASEAAANYLTNQLAEKYKDDPKYFVNGEFQANLLSEAEKAQIRDLTAGIGAVIGGAAGDSSYNAQLAGVIGQNAVENNVDSVKDIQNAKAYSEKMYKDTCAAYGLGEPACGIQIRKDGFEILKGTALVLLPTEPYEFIPVGKGVGIVLKGTNKLIAVYKDIKAAEKAVEKAGAKVEIPNAVNINAQDALNRKLSGLEKAQKMAEVTKTLPDGRIRYYNTEVAARTAGQTRGASFVTEYDPKTGAVRQWMESYDHGGNVIRVHPKSINGQPVIGQHYPPTGKEIQAGAK